MPLLLVGVAAAAAAAGAAQTFVEDSATPVGSHAKNFTIDCTTDGENSAWKLDKATFMAPDDEPPSVSALSWHWSARVLYTRHCCCCCSSEGWAGASRAERGEVGAADVGVV